MSLKISVKNAKRVSKITTRTIFIPCTPELQNDINAILSQPGIEYVDMKFVPAMAGAPSEYDCAGVWLVFRQEEGALPLV